MAGTPCSAIGLDLAIDAHGVVASTIPLSAPTSVPSAKLVTLLKPVDGAAVSGSAFTLAWSPYPQAAAYDIQLWLAHATSTQALNAHSTVLVSRRVQLAHVVIRTAGLVSGIYRWRVAATDRSGTLITAWTPDQTLRLQTH